MKNKITKQYIFTLAGISFLLHVIWENLHAPLYTGYESFAQHFPPCFIATIGDIFITLFVLLLFLFVKKKLPETFSDFHALAFIGFIIAIFIEWKALILGSWGYGELMPIIPILKVGLTPILQMIILLPLSFYLAKVFSKKTT